MTLLISYSDVAPHVTPEEAINCVEHGFRDFTLDPTINHPRRRLHVYSENVVSRLNSHMGAIPSLNVTGVYINHHHMQRKLLGKEIEQRTGSEGIGYYILYNTASGDPLCIIYRQQTYDERSPDIRTAATTTLGVKLLARKNAHSIGLFGSGFEARIHLPMLCSIRDVKQIMVYSPTQSHRDKFAQEMSAQLEKNVLAVSDPEKLVRESDIIVCATNANVPVFNGDWLEPGTHVTAIVGSTFKKLGLRRRELDDRTVERSDLLIVNSKEQIIEDDVGNIVEPMAKGVITMDRIHELGDLLSGKCEGRTNDNQITLFFNNAGQGVADVAVAYLIFRKAVEKGIGTQLEKPEILL